MVQLRILQISCLKLGITVLNKGCMACVTAIVLRTAVPTTAPGQPRGIATRGIYVILADGSVRFINSHVESSPNWAWNADLSLHLPSYYGAGPIQFLGWQRLNCSRDGSP